MRRDHPDYVRARAICKKIGYEFPLQYSEAELFYKVIERAILDLVEKKYRQEALEYLFQPEIPEAERCGVDSVWIQDKILQSGLVSKEESNE